MSSRPATVPPQNIDAEENVLGALMLSKHAVTAAAEILKASDFYRHSHGYIFQAALDLDARGEPVDGVTLSAELERSGKMKEVNGGHLRIHELAALVPASANVAHYARIVREHAIRRELILAGGLISQLGWEGSDTADALLAAAEDHLTRATAHSAPQAAESLHEASLEMFERIETARRTGEPYRGLPTGLRDLDRLTLGLHPAQLALIAARPGMGKTTLAQQWAEEMADAGHPTAFFSLEMTKNEVALRSLSRATGIAATTLLAGVLTDEEYAQVRLGASKLARPMYVDDTKGLTPTTLRARLARMQRKHDVQAAFVDYLQLLLPGVKTSNRQEAVSEISRQLKIIAGNLNLPMVAVSQLNRELENRSDKRPMLSDLRESGSLEQDADVVLFIYRDEMYNKESEDVGIAELILAKQRMGKANVVVRTAYSARKSSFSDLKRN